MNKNSKPRSPQRPPTHRAARGGMLFSGTFFLSWVVLGGAILLPVLNQTRLFLGYEPFDSQWGILGMLSLFGIIFVFFLSLALFLLCPIAYLIARKQGNPIEARRALQSLGVTLTGFVIFIIF